MDVSAFRFAIETLEKHKDKWSVLCLMADDLEAARMAWTLVEMLPGDGVRIALIDPSLKDKPERILWEHLKDAEPDRPFELTPVPNFHHDPGGWGRSMPPRFIPAALSHTTSFDKVDKVAPRPDLNGLYRTWRPGAVLV